MLSKNIKNVVKMTFGFSLYTAFLLVIIVLYFRKILGELRELRLLKGSKVC